MGCTTAFQHVAVGGHQVGIDKYRGPHAGFGSTRTFKPSKLPYLSTPVKHLVKVPSTSVVGHRCRIAHHQATYYLKYFSVGYALVTLKPCLIHAFTVSVNKLLRSLPSASYSMSSIIDTEQRSHQRYVYMGYITLNFGYNVFQLLKSVAPGNSRKCNSAEPSCLRLPHSHSRHAGSIGPA